MSKYLSIIVFEYVQIFEYTGGGDWMQMNQRTCCFTGHRDIPADDISKVARCTEQCIEGLIGRGVRYFGVGGAIGYDTLAAQVLVKMREASYPNIRIILVYPFDGYTSRWSAEQQRVYRELLHCYDKRVCVAEHPSREAYLQRNRHLVDNSAYCISYCTKETGGTAYTLRYAQSKGLEIINVADMIR